MHTNVCVISNTSSANRELFDFLSIISNPSDSWNWDRHQALKAVVQSTRQDVASNISSEPVCEAPARVAVDPGFTFVSFGHAHLQGSSYSAVCCYAAAIALLLVYWQGSRSHLQYTQFRTTKQAAGQRPRRLVWWPALACLAFTAARLIDVVAGGAVPQKQLASISKTGAALACLCWAVLSLLLWRGQAQQGAHGGRQWLLHGAACLAVVGEFVGYWCLFTHGAIVTPLSPWRLLPHAAGVAMQLYASSVLILRHPARAQLEEEASGVCGQGPLPVFAEYSAGLLGRLTFSYVSAILAKGYRGTLGAAVSCLLPPPDRVADINSRFSRHWQAELRLPAHQISLARACWRTEGGLALSALPFKLLNDALHFCGPIFLDLLLKTESDRWRSYCFAGCMFAGTIAGQLVDGQHLQRVYRMGFRLRSLLSAQVHAKVFHLSPAARSKFGSGRIFSLVSSDAETVQLFCQNIFMIMSSPLRIIVAVFLLYQRLGPSSIVAVVCILALVPNNVLLVRRASQALGKALSYTDERTKLEGELVAGMEVVKCFTWEELFHERISVSRRYELLALWRVNVLAAVRQFIMFSVPTVLPVATFGAYLLIGNTLTTAEAFTALALFNVLRSPMFSLPQILTQMVQSRVSIKRLQEFLSAEDMPDAPPLPPVQRGDTAIHLSGDFTWDPAGPASLMDVSLDVRAGSLVVVVGATGSGKTTLLSAMLGLVQQVRGPLPVMHGRIAYVPQAAFIMGATVRDNILFGCEYNEARYSEAISAARLDTDFKLMLAGDATELGDRGVNLSGGQKQRISIARAVYSGADICLMDDVLSALDSKVGRKVFEKAIRGVLADKTIVLTTNQLQFVNRADHVLFLSNGRIAEAGAFSELMAAGKGFAAMMKESQVEEDELDDGRPSASELQRTASIAARVPSSSVPEGDKAVGKLTSEERMSLGVVSWPVVRTYIKALGGTLSFVVLVAGFVAVECLRVLTTAWLSVWTNSTRHPDASQQSNHGAMYYLGIYAAIAGVQLACQFGIAILAAYCGQVAARRLHDSLLARLLNAPMAFFHTTPSGRIINRLAKDTEDIDRHLGYNLSIAFRYLLQLGSTIVLVAVMAPYALLPTVAIVFMFFWLYAYFQCSMRQIKRLDAITRSPVFTSLSESISGVATIRAFGAQKRLVARHCGLVDKSALMALLSQSMGRWLSLRLETLGATALLLTMLVAVGHCQSTDSMGLLLSYTMQITNMINTTLRVSSIAETSFNAVERVLEYTDIEQERALPSVVGGQRSADMCPANWPAMGVIEFQDVMMRYRPGLPLVLRGVSFKAEALDKVGVVGRTGAGKSSMIGCLFRLVEISSGCIRIDGVNIAEVGLRQLRSKTAIIPQVPVMFTGSICLNLSPFGQHTEDEMWNALRRVHLDGVVSSWPGGLSSPLQADGAPLSAGQKQLLALARALLNPSRVLVLDEATANVDVETDLLIQRTMREQFADRTILAIAHRLHTIIDYDKILVLDKGLVSEFGPPGVLLSRPGGVFSSLVDDTGEATARFLRSASCGKLLKLGADGAARSSAEGAKYHSVPLHPPRTS